MEDKLMEEIRDIKKTTEYPLKNKKMVIFDMDGTLADTYQIFVDFNNKNYKELGTAYLDPEKVTSIRKLSIQEVAKVLDIDWYELPEIFLKFYSQMKDAFVKARAFKGIDHVVKKLSTEGYVLGIISSNREENITSFLESNNLKYFDFIKHEGIFHKKDDLMHIAMQEQNIDAKDTVYIGDMLRDLEASQRANVDFVFVDWGFNAKSLVEKHNPEYIVESPKELLALFCKAD